MLTPAMHTISDRPCLVPPEEIRLLLQRCRAVRRDLAGDRLPLRRFDPIRHQCCQVVSRKSADDPVLRLFVETLCGQQEP
jgi:hypothetical protein